MLLWSPDPGDCVWCGMTHGPKCPFVKAYEIDKEGHVTRVEFFSPEELASKPQPVEPSMDQKTNYPTLKPIGVARL